MTVNSANRREFIMLGLWALGLCQNKYFKPPNFTVFFHPNAALQGLLFVGTKQRIWVFRAIPEANNKHTWLLSSVYEFFAGKIL